LPDLFTMMRRSGHSHPRAGAELPPGEICSQTYRPMFLIIISPMASVRAFRGSGQTARPIARRLGKAIIPQSRKCNRSRSANGEPGSEILQTFYRLYCEPK
jgi:hypothetical protein